MAYSYDRKALSPEEISADRSNAALYSLGALATIIVLVWAFSHSL
jgi:hypothetical protein